MNKMEKKEKIISWVAEKHRANGKSAEYARYEAESLRNSGVRGVSDDTCYILTSDEFRKLFVSFLNWF